MKCYSCNRTINRPPSQLRNDKNFCNHECYSKFKSDKWSKKKNPRWSGGEEKFKCLVCDKSCVRKKYGRKQNKYCSITCSAKDRGTYQRGQDHPMWKGIDGKTAKPLRNLKRYKDWMDRVLKRDKLCQNCGSNKDLHVHHIYPLAKMVKEYINKHGSLNVDDPHFYKTKNGQVLCRACHRKTFNENPL